MRRGRDVEGIDGPRRQRRRVETLKALREWGMGNEEGVSPKRISVRSKRHRMPLAKMFVVN